MTQQEIRRKLAAKKAQVTKLEKALAQANEKKAARAAKTAREIVLTDADKGPLKFGNYSDKCFVVYGGTKSRHDLFTALKNKGLCSFNPALRIGVAGVKAENAQPQGGWLFFKSKTADLKALKAICK